MHTKEDNIRLQTKPEINEPGLKVQTNMHVGRGLASIGETLFFGLLDVLQKPTDWLYARTVGRNTQE